MPAREAAPRGVGLKLLDHLTHNVERGNMDLWAGFYERIANFREIRYFDIEGKQTGLVSRALTSPCGKIRIPINESSDDKSQIAEFIRDYRGEGIQHLALGTDDIYANRRRPAARAAAVFHGYAGGLLREDRRPRARPQGGRGAPARAARLLIDGSRCKRRDTPADLHQHRDRPDRFFQIIQRKGNEGFGEGNFGEPCSSPSRKTRCGAARAQSRDGIGQGRMR